MNTAEGIAYVETTKTVPPLTVGAMSLAGIPLSDWLIILTIVYTVLQLFFLLRDKWWRQRGSKE